MEKTHRINEKIRVSPIRVIDADGSQLGVISTDEAMSKAREAGLDLVEVAPNEKPPVCRIMDFGKFKYQQRKKRHRGQVHQTKTKELRLRPKTGDHDVDFKVRQAIGFLQHRNKVQISVIFRGRENAHIDEGQRLLEQVLGMLEEFGKCEGKPVQQGRRIVCIVAPK